MLVGDTCAACVPDPERPNATAWIITRIERVLPTGQFVVRDEYSQSADPDSGLYTVPSTRITQFPAVWQTYAPGDRVLALWCDEESHEWSTMFYEAVVVSTNGTRLVVEFPGYASQAETEPSRVTRFPVGFADVISDELESSPVEVKAERRVMFTRGAAGAGTGDVIRISDVDLTRLAGEEGPAKRLHCVAATPLIDLLGDEEIAGNREMGHVTMCGSMVVTLKAGREREPALMADGVMVGRLSRILHEWRK
jgi:hypothetical protein